MLTMHFTLCVGWFKNQAMWHAKLEVTLLSARLAGLHDVHTVLLLSGIGQAQYSQPNVYNIIVCSLPGASALKVLA